MYFKQPIHGRKQCDTQHWQHRGWKLNCLQHSLVHICTTTSNPTCACPDRLLAVLYYHWTVNLCILTTTMTTTQTKMVLSRAHLRQLADDVAHKRQVTHFPMQSIIWRCCHLTVTITITWRDVIDYHFPPNFVKVGWLVFSWSYCY